jgi:hypothetical protein
VQATDAADDAFVTTTHWAQQHNLQLQHNLQAYADACECLGCKVPSEMSGLYTHLDGALPALYVADLYCAVLYVASNTSDGALPALY